MLKHVFYPSLGLAEGKNVVTKVLVRLRIRDDNILMQSVDSVGVAIRAMVSAAMLCSAQEHEIKSTTNGGRDHFEKLGSLPRVIARSLFPQPKPTENKYFRLVGSSTTVYVFWCPFV